MLETLLKRIKIRRRSSSAGSDALATPALLSNPDALADSQVCTIPVCLGLGEANKKLILVKKILVTYVYIYIYIYI